MTFISKIFGITSSIIEGMDKVDKKRGRLHSAKIWVSVDPKPSDSYCFRASIDPPYMELIQADSMIDIYQSKVFPSFDIAFGELTQQVLVASKKYDSAFYFGRGGKYFNRENKEWVDYPELIFYCQKCSNKKILKGPQAMDLDGYGLLCEVCEGNMWQKIPTPNAGA